jgi:hypothetical protein
MSGKGVRVWRMEVLQAVRPRGHMAALAHERLFSAMFSFLCVTSQTDHSVVLLHYFSKVSSCYVVFDEDKSMSAKSKARGANLPSLHEMIYLFFCIILAISQYYPLPQLANHSRHVEKQCFKALHRLYLTFCLSLLLSKKYM